MVVDVGTRQTVEVTRLTGPGETSPTASQVTVLLLDRGSVRLEPVAIEVTIGTPSRAFVEFIAPTTEPLQLFVHWGDAVGSSTRPIRVVDLLDTSADFEVTYVDRVDVCVGRAMRLPSGRLICSRGDAGISVYDPDGGLEAIFDGFNAAVRGDELWSDTAVGLEHRTDTPAGLRFDGVLPYTQGRVLGDSRRGVALRTTGDTFIEVTWDGGALGSVALGGLTTLSSRDVTAFRAGGSIASVNVGDFPVSTGNTCLMTRGCTTVVCPPVVQCLGGFTVGLTEREIFLSITTFQGEGLASVVTTLNVRPREDTGVSRLIELPAGVQLSRPPFAGVHFPTALERLALEDSSHPGQTLLPRADEERTWLEVWNHGGRLVGADETWLIAAMSPFRLRFHRLAP